MQKTWCRIILVSLVLVCSIAGYSLYCYVFPKTSGFTKRGWALFDREKLIADFIAHPKLLLGKTKAEIIEQLGLTAYVDGEGFDAFNPVTSETQRRILSNHQARLLVYGAPLDPNIAVGILFDTSGPSGRVIAVEEGYTAMFKFSALKHTKNQVSPKLEPEELNESGKANSYLKLRRAPVCQ